MNLSDTYREYARIFREHGFDSPEVEAAYLLSDIAGIPHTIIPFSTGELDNVRREKADSWLARRLRGEPYQYICGWAAFRELKLAVGPGCLIPRPETELLVDRIFDVLPQHGSFCEWGTGSGAIVLSVGYERPDVRACASELFPAALAYAMKNRDALGLNRVRLESGDLGAPFTGEKFDVIAANLPYISPSEQNILPENVRCWEPEEALFAEDSGYALLDRAIREAPAFLKPGGVLLLEMGETQGAHLQETAGAWHRAEIFRDQYGVDRFFLGSL